MIAVDDRIVRTRHLRRCVAKTTLLASLTLLHCGPSVPTFEDDGEQAGAADGVVVEGDRACEPVYEGMVCIPEGPFIMGSDDLDLVDDLEMPRQEVWLSQYHIDRHEVTFGEYRECIVAGACTEPVMEDPLNDLTFGCRWGQAGIDEYPVACIGWLQAQAYCHWRGAELPTEAQWEKAGRGTDGRDYPWGNAEPNCILASMADEEGVWGCGTGMVERPGSHSPQGDSPYGVQDMSGNVLELVADWLGPGQPNLGADPVGLPESSTDGFKVSKGGSFASTAFDERHGGWMQLAWRGQGGSADPGFGFRCAVAGEAAP